MDVFELLEKSTPIFKGKLGHLWEMWHIDNHLEDIDFAPEEKLNDDYKDESDIGYMPSKKVLKILVDYYDTFDDFVDAVRDVEPKHDF